MYNVELEPRVLCIHSMEKEYFLQNSVRYTHTFFTLQVLVLLVYSFTCYIYFCFYTDHWQISSCPL